jgi:hypothetical protein
MKSSVALSLLLSVGCSYAWHGSTENVLVKTEPAGAQLTVDSLPERYETPAAVDLARRDDHKLIVTKEGYAPHVEMLQSVASDTILYNLGLLLLAPLGLAIDYATGAAYELNNPNLVHCEEQLVRSSPPIAYCSKDLPEARAGDELMVTLTSVPASAQEKPFH